MAAKERACSDGGRTATSRAFERRATCSAASVTGRHACREAAVCRWLARRWQTRGAIARAAGRQSRDTTPTGKCRPEVHALRRKAGEGGQRPRSSGRREGQAGGCQYRQREVAPSQRADGSGKGARQSNRTQRPRGCRRAVTRATSGRVRRARTAASEAPGQTPCTESVSVAREPRDATRGQAPQSEKEEPHKRVRQAPKKRASVLQPESGVAA